MALNNVSAKRQEIIKSVIAYAEKTLDKEKEQAFIEAFCIGDTQGNATQSCIKAGWSKDKSPRQQGAYLKKKYTAEIREKNEERITSTSGMAISVLQDLLNFSNTFVKAH